VQQSPVQAPSSFSQVFISFCQIQRFYRRTVDNKGVFNKRKDSEVDVGLVGLGTIHSVCNRGDDPQNTY